MINDNDIRISNKSYVNKDFASIYPELLDLVKDLTSKWDPETSNESDPGIVLLKLMAFLGDKVNYNIDKNTLECFMPSATQESSMRNLCDTLGYEMGYYNASQASLTFTYTGDEPEFRLPPLSTVVSTDDDSVSYVLIEGQTLQKGQPVSDCDALQGELAQLRILDSTNTVVTMDNIDDRNRLYFSERMVAQNGVFVTNRDGDGSFWKRVSNLNVVAPNSRVFKFGYDSERRLPYIEFPQDLANVIGSGLEVSYIRTDGENGGVNARSLTKVSSAPSGFAGSVINYQASYGGADPETVDDAYNGFKRTVGTFNTLVSCRDYSNYIKGMLDGNGNHKVSNAQVSDRRDDINYGTRVLTFTENGMASVNVDSNSITAFDLCLYPLNPYKTTGLKEFSNSFKSLTFGSIPTTITEDLEFDDAKTISHDYKVLDKDNDIYLIKNYASLNAKIATIKKVNATEQAEVLNNVLKALANVFNASKLDYGSEIPFEKLVSVMENADPRISYVTLDEPKLTTKFMNGNNVETPLIDPLNASADKPESYLRCLASNILAGRVEPFEYENEFRTELGQQNGSIIKKACKITTLSNITIPSGESNKVELADNEVVIFATPDLVDEISYTYGVMFELTLNEVNGVAREYSANEVLELQNGESLVINYKNADGNEYTRTYSGGTIIRPSFNSSDVDRMIQRGDYHVLGSKDSISILTPNSYTLEKTTHCYWIRNNETNNLFPEGAVDGQFETMLSEGEYFFYANDDFTSLITLGSGTVIKTTLNNDWSLGANSKTSVSNIVEHGLSDLRSSFVDVRFSSEDPMGISEMSVLTLTSGDSVWVEEGSALSLVQDGKNKLKQLPDDCKIGFKFEGESYPSGTISGAPIAGLHSFALARLDLSCGPSTAQKLSSGQSVTITYIDPENGNGTSDATLSGGTSFMCNTELQHAGGSVNLIATNLATDEPYYPISFYSYVVSDGRDFSKERNLRGLGERTYKEDSVTDDTYALPNLDLDASSKEPALLMIFWAPKVADTELPIHVTGTDAKVGKLEDFADANDGYDCDPGMTVLNLENAESISFTPKAGKITLGYLRYYSGVNSRLGISQAQFNDSLFGMIKGISNGTFQWSFDVANDDAIEVSDLSDPLAFFDPNNMASKFTLEEIDFSESDISILRSSKA